MSISLASKKHLHIISGLSTGGAETMLQKLLLHPLLRQTEPVVISLSDLGIIGQRLRDNGIEVHVLNFKDKARLLLTLVRFLRLIRSLGTSVIQGWMYHGNLFATLGWLLSARGASLHWNIRHTPGDLKLEKKNTLQTIKLGALLSFLPRSIIYNSHTSAEIHHGLGYRKDKEHIIENGFDLNLYAPQKDKVRDGFNIALIGRFHPMKNHRLFYEVASMLSPLHPHVKFIMAGRGVPSVSWHQEWQQLGLAPDRLLIQDEIKVDAQVFSEIDLLVLCSSWGEAFPNILGEAMACGVPCVVTDVGDSARIVSDSGKVIPIGDKGLLFKAIEGSLKMGKEEYHCRSRRARDIVEQRYSIETIVRKYHDLYNF